jgi:hypothetical protein
MTEIAQDAERMSLLLQYGVASGDDVVSWADSLITRLDSSPDSLLELSTTAPSKTADLLSCLRRLSVGADFWTALRSAIPRLRDYVAAHPDRAEGIANHLFLTVCSFSALDVPDDLHFLYRFDDAFSLAREGTYGTPETVLQEFLHELDKFKPAA